jgi:hypothetical protein
VSLVSLSCRRLVDRTVGQLRARRVISFLSCCQQSTVDVDSRLVTSLRSERTRMTQRVAATAGASPKESRMTPQRTAVITRSASRDVAIGPESRRTTTVAASPWAQLGQAERFLVCNELRCLSKGRLAPPRTLYGGRHECNDRPQRSGYVQGARVDSRPGRWWVWSEFLLRARRCSEADRRRDANSLRPCSQRRHNAHQPIAARTTYTIQQAPYGAAPTATDTGCSRSGSRPATLTRGRKQ